MRVNEDFKDWNAEKQRGNPTSVHGFWKKALKLRKEHLVLVSSQSCMSEFIVCLCELFEGLWVLSPYCPSGRECVRHRSAIG